MQSNRKRNVEPLRAEVRAALAAHLEVTTLDVLARDSGLSAASIRRAARGEPVTVATARLVDYLLIARPAPITRADAA